MTETARDQEEQDLRIDQMTINIEKMRQELRMDSRTFLLQCIIAASAAIGVGVAIGRFFLGN